MCDRDREILAGFLIAVSLCGTLPLIEWLQ